MSSKGKPVGPPAPGKGTSLKGEAPRTPPEGKGETKGKYCKGKEGAASNRTWGKAAHCAYLKDNNGETLSRFKALACYRAEDVLDPDCIDWTRIEDVGVILGSLEIEEGLTGIVVAQVDGRLVGFRDVCKGRSPEPIKEYFAAVLGRVLRQDARREEKATIRLAEYRITHPFANGAEYETIRSSLRSCIGRKTGLQGLDDSGDTPDVDPWAWLRKNLGFTDFGHSLVRVLNCFFTLHKSRYDHDPTTLAAEGAGGGTLLRPLRGELTAFTGVMEVIRGLATLKDRMTLTDEIAINSAMGLTADDPNYVRRTHDNPFYNAAGGARAELLWALGKLTAYDALINNWDRLSVSLVWDNKGNFTNVVVEEDTLDLVGIDQCVYPIDPGPGLDTYQERLGALVEYAYTLEASAFQCADLEALDSDQTAEVLVQIIVEEESARERREQAQIMGKVPQRSGPSWQEPAVRGTAMEGRHAWLQDLGKKFFIATGSSQSRHSSPATSSAASPTASARSPWERTPRGRRPCAGSAGSWPRLSTRRPAGI